MKQTIHIEAPVETMFDFSMDPAKSWDLLPIHTQLDDVKVTKEGVGTYTSWHFKIAGLSVRGFDVVTDVVPNKHITDRSSNAVVGTRDYDFEPEGSGTKLTMEHHSESIWRLPPLRNLIGLVAGRANAPFMARVKDAIQTTATESPTASR